MKRYDGLLLVNEHADLYFLLHYFVVQIVPFKLDELQIIVEGEKNIGLKASTKPVMR